MKNNSPIGFFDSGIGGATVLKKSLEIMPDENFVYISDSKYNPYGDKSDEEILLRCEEAADRLINGEGCKTVVIACNTASAKAAQTLREKYDSIPIIATEPAYKMVHDINPNGFTLVLATRGTLESEKFHRLYHKYNNNNTKLIECVGLADLIENGKKDDIKIYLEKTLGKYSSSAQNVVLGCTHYPLIENEIKKVLKNARFFDGSDGVSRRLYSVLKSENLQNPDGFQKIKFIDTSENVLEREKKKERFYKIIGKEYEKY